jgi:hypothetical protein
LATEVLYRLEQLHAVSLHEDGAHVHSVPVPLDAARHVSG